MSDWLPLNVALFVIALAGLISIGRVRRREERDRAKQRARQFQGELE